jgi:hypothetical protein
MTTSLIETAQIEAYLTGSAQPDDALFLEAKMIIDPELQDKMNWQKKVHELVLAYGRKQLMQEIDNIHRQLFTLPEHAGFGNKIRRLFRQR